MVDARSSARFHGEAPEPRPGLPSGGMKGALNLPYTNFLDPEQGTVKSKDMLAKGVRWYVCVCVCVCVFVCVCVWTKVWWFASISASLSRIKEKDVYVVSPTSLISGLYCWKMREREGGREGGRAYKSCLRNWPETKRRLSHTQCKTCSVEDRTKFPHYVQLTLEYMYVSG